MQEKISVIIPALNEADLIYSQVKSLFHKGNDSALEVIVVDGGSSDNTRELALKAGAQVIDSAPGRSVQMNAGAARATGDVFYFVHADLTVPDTFVKDIRKAVAGGFSYGCYQVAFDRPVKGLRFNSSLSKYQGIFF